VLEEGSELIAKVIEVFIENKGHEPDWKSLLPLARFEPPES
jgi:hypothetical protein